MKSEGPHEASRYLLKWCMRISNILIFIGGFFLLSIGIWTFKNAMFTEELLGNALYVNTAKVITAVGCLSLVISCFGIYAAQKV